MTLYTYFTSSPTIVFNDRFKNFLIDALSIRQLRCFQKGITNSVEIRPSLAVFVESGLDYGYTRRRSNA